MKQILTPGLIQRASTTRSGFLSALEMIPRLTERETSPNIMLTVKLSKIPKETFSLKKK